MEQSQSAEGERQVKEVKETDTEGKSDLLQVSTVIQNQAHGTEIILMIKQMKTFFLNQSETII